MEDVHICEAFRCVLSPDNETRERAEAALSSLEGKVGLYPALCRIAVSADDPHTRQSAVLFLKNSCRCWMVEASRRLGRPQAPLADQLYLRGNIIHFLSPTLPTPVRAQFLKVAKEVAKNVPAREWTELLPQLDSALHADSVEMQTAGLALLYQVVKAVCKRLSSQRKPEFSLLADRYFDRLLACLQHSPDGRFERHALILKSYFKGTYIEFLEPLSAEQRVRAWLQRICGLLSTHASLTDNQAGWTCMKWAMRIAHRCISRETSLAAMSADLRHITELFLRDFASDLAQLCRDILILSKSKLTPDSVRLYCWKYLAVAAKTASTKSLVHAYHEELLTDVVLPQICRVPAEEVLWRESPSEFLHQENDYMMTALSCKLSAVDFVVAVCNGGLLRQVLSFVSALLAKPLSPLHKEAVLLLFGSLASVDELRNNYETNISQGLKLHVLPELQSPVGFLRFRGLWTYARFACCKIDPEQQVQVLRCVCQLLTDHELPVRVEASTTLAKVLNWACADSLLQPEIANLLDVFKANMELLDSEDLIDALESLIDRYSAAIVPHAPVLIEKLCSTFTRTASQGEKMTATPVLSVMIKITAALKDHKADLLAISHLLLPILQFTLSPQGESFFEEGLSLLTNLVAYLDAQSVRHLYPALPLLAVALVGRSPDIQPYAFEFYEQCFNPLANFIAKDRDALASVGGKQLVVGIARNFLAMRQDNVGYEYHFAAKLLMCLTENLEHFYEEEGELLMETVRFLVAQEERAWKLLGLELLSVLFFRNVPLTLSGLPSCEEVLQYWFRNLHMFKSPSTKLHIALAFVVFLQKFNILPDLLRRNLSGILQNLTQMLTELEAPQDISDGSEEEDDSWSPIEDDLYNTPWQWPDLVRSTRQALEHIQVTDPQTARELNASLPTEARETFSRLLAEVDGLQ